MDGVEFPLGISYLVQAGEAVDSEVFVRELALRVPQHGDSLMTIAQQLEQKGIEQGIEIGEQRGLKKVSARPPLKSPEPCWKTV